MAFGTGHHGTTLGCLWALDRLAGEGFAPARVVDVGCGTAVLGMAAARIWPEARVLASDIDAVAVEVAEVNLVANGMAGAVACVEAAGFAHPDLAASAPYDLILANILKGPLVALAPELCGNLSPKGMAILSGILNEQAEDVAGVYTRSGTNLLHREQIGDWTTLILQKV